MDNIDNIDDNINNEEYIRPPDKVKRERLIEPPQWEEGEYEEDILQNILNYEKSIKNYFIEEQMRRKESFNALLFKMKKISNYDKEVEEIYNIIEPIIESYCEQAIQYYEVDKATYERIFRVISSMRINTEPLKKIIMCL